MVCHVVKPLQEEDALIIKFKSCKAIVDNRASQHFPHHPPYLSNRSRESQHLSVENFTWTAVDMYFFM